MKHRLIHSIVPMILLPLSLFGVIRDDIFREYDIRGVVGEEFEISDLFELGRAVCTQLLTMDPQLHQVVVGADGRIHSPAMKQELVRAIQAYGLEVIDIGLCATPTVYFALHQQPLHTAGLMITASHNPGEYNGLKVCLNRALLSGQEITAIRDLYRTSHYLPVAEENRKIKEIDMISSYVDYMAQQFPHLIGQPFHIILDCGNGSAGAILPSLLKKMDWQNVELLYPEVDGTYPHHIADPSAEKNMEDLKQLLAKSNAAFGLGFDGDADRMGAMTKAGRLIKGDQLVGIYSKQILQSYPGSAIVFDVSSSKSVMDLVKQRGGVPVIAKTGIRNIKEAMTAQSAYLGGEMSCHIIFKDRYFGYDDGIYSMMRLLETVVETKQSLEELLEECPAALSTPTYRLPCDRAICFEIVEAIKAALNHSDGIELITLDGVRVHFPYGWAIVRPSNTEPLISMRFEGDSPEGLQKVQEALYPIIQRYIKDGLPQPT